MTKCAFLSLEGGGYGASDQYGRIFKAEKSKERGCSAAYKEFFKSGVLAKRAFKSVLTKKVFWRRPRVSDGFVLIKKHKYA